MLSFIVLKNQLISVKQIEWSQYDSDIHKIPVNSISRHVEDKKSCRGFVTFVIVIKSFIEILKIIFLMFEHKIISFIKMENDWKM